MIFSTFLIIFFLSGCALEITSEIYLSDIYDSIKNYNANFTIPSTLKLEITSKESFQEYRARITSILREYFREVSNARYEEINYSSFYVADIEIPFSLEESLDSMIGFSTDKEGKLIMSFDKESFDNLNKTILKEFYYTIDPKEIAISVILINDIRKDVTVEFQGVYINNIPYPFVEKTTLKNKQKLVISFSNVLKDYMIAKGKTAFVKIYW